MPRCKERAAKRVSDARRIVGAAAVIVAVAMLGNVRLLASECIGFGADFLLQYSAAVFSGRVVRQELVRREQTYGDVVAVTFDVTRTFKGHTRTPLVLHQWVLSGMTDFDNPFATGREYVVFARDNEGRSFEYAPPFRLVARHCDATLVDTESGRQLLQLLSTAPR